MDNILKFNSKNKKLLDNKGELTEVSKLEALCMLQKFVNIIQEKIERIDDALKTVVDNNIRNRLIRDKEDLEEKRDKNVTQFYSDSVSERFTRWAPGNTKEIIEEVKNEIDLLNNFRLKRMLAVDAYNLMTDEEVAQAAIDAVLFEENQ